VSRASKSGIMLTSRRDRVRISPHFYNGEPELEALADFVRTG
jgi:selenocysteine lyase/cysteine desulfurase